MHVGPLPSASELDTTLTLMDQIDPLIEKYCSYKTHTWGGVFAVALFVALIAGGIFSFDSVSQAFIGNQGEMISSALSIIGDKSYILEVGAGLLGCGIYFGRRKWKRRGIKKELEEMGVLAKVIKDLANKRIQWKRFPEKTLSAGKLSKKDKKRINLGVAYREALRKAADELAKSARKVEARVKVDPAHSGPVTDAAAAAAVIARSTTALLEGGAS